MFQVGGFFYFFFYVSFVSLPFSLMDVCFGLSDNQIKHVNLVRFSLTCSVVVRTFTNKMEMAHASRATG